MSKIIGVMSKKGGAGKTTVVFNLAHAVATSQKKKKVLAIDADVTEALIEYAELADGRGELNFDCIGLIKNFSNEKIYRDYDYVFIDCNPTIEQTQKEVVEIADAIVIPVIPVDSADVTQAIKQLRLILESKKENGNLKIFLLITKLRTISRNAQAVIEQLQEFRDHGVTILNTTLGDRVAFTNPRQGSVFSLDKRGKAAQEITALATELLNKIK